MADAAIHGHEHEDQRGFFTRWFMSTNHKDIGILYLIVSALVGFIAVAFTVYMRMELMDPGVQYMCEEGARFMQMPTRLYTKRPPLECLDYRPRYLDDVLCGYSCPVWRFWQLLHAAADRCARYGVPADEQPVFLAVCRRYNAGVCSVLAPAATDSLALAWAGFCIRRCR